MLEKADIDKDDLMNALYVDSLFKSCRQLPLTNNLALANFLFKMKMFSRKRLEDFIIDKVTFVLK